MRQLVVIAVMCVFSFQSRAQQGPSDVEVPDITVLGVAPKPALNYIPTVSELSGQRLERRKQSTVGETLSHEAGVSSTYFGPNASRPVIRGMDGDRVRILQNETGVLDASAASQDHAVAIEPLIVDRMEIVRGPGALLYGSQAVGGVVNMVTNRIPEKAPEKLKGKAEGRVSSTDMGRSGVVGMDFAPTGHWAVHVDGAARGADDYHVPDYARTADVRAADPVPDEQKGRAFNSFNHSGTGALGTSYVFDKGFVGTSFSDYESSYGTLAERFVHINMLQQRWDLAGELRDSGFVNSMRFKNSYSHYRHDEIEDGSLGTSFKNDGDEARADFRHQEVLGFTGVFGLQANQFTFSAKGDESFIPPTLNSGYSAFLFEERAEGILRPSFGLRYDISQVKSKDDPVFGAGQTRNFDGGSASLGLLYQMTNTEALVLNSAYTERAPNYEELFANGQHAATGLFEIGDTNLKKEQSQSVELSWRHKGDSSHARVGAFLQDFKHYITLSPSGAIDAGSGLPIYNYLSMDARLFGGEAEFRQELPAWIPGGQLQLELKGDVVRGINRVNGENLPRMTPIRESVSLLYKADRLSTDLEVQRVERQDLTAPNETATGSYMLVNWGVETPIRIGSTMLSAFGRLNNIFNQEARNHVSVIKDLAPLPGRNLILGLQATF